MLPGIFWVASRSYWNAGTIGEYKIFTNKENMIIFWRFSGNLPGASGTLVKLDVTKTIDAAQTKVLKGG